MDTVSMSVERHSQGGPVTRPPRLASDEALGALLADALRPVCVGLGLVFSLLGGWYMLQLRGEALTTMVSVSGLLALAMVVAAVWFERNELPARAANPVAALIGMAVVLHCLLLMVSVPAPSMTTHLMIAVLGFGCLLLSVPWFVALGVLSVGGWLWVAGARRVESDWYHFGLALVEATLFGALILVLRIRAYRDIQVLRQRDRALVERLERANHAAQAAVQAKGEFLANMSHEIRTPMTAMLGMTELLQMTDLSEEQADFADTIARSGDSLLTLVNDILDFSKIEAGQLTVECVPFNLRRLVHDVRDLLAVKAQQGGLTLVADYEDVIPARFRGDPTRLQQVLVNLVGNAIKFTHSGGVVLRVRAQALAEQQWQVQLDVEDTGIGIAADKLDRVFDAFTQADASTTRKFGGTGLGLAISSELTRLMGGELSVRSVEDQGSTFTLTLPLMAEEAVTVYPTDRPAQLGFSGRVLIVEDNEENRLLASRMLASLGCDVTVACDGEEAVVAVAQETFDLVFMDCQMRNLSGFEATERIRAAERTDGRRTPIVALTANVMPKDRARCEAAGMDGFIAKPFSYGDLRGVLSMHLAPATTEHLTGAAG